MALARSLTEKVEASDESLEGLFAGLLNAEREQETLVDPSSPVITRKRSDEPSTVSLAFESKEGSVSDRVADSASAGPLELDAPAGHQLRLF